MLASRLILIVLAGFGTFAGAQLSLEHMQTGEVCPELGGLPACYLVFVMYGMILLSAVLIRNKVSGWLFLIGWLVVFGLAASGVTLELIQGETCPPGPAGIPQCFISLAMATACLLLYWHASGRRLGAIFMPWTVTKET